jgi:hypothetical protein
VGRTPARRKTAGRGGRIRGEIGGGDGGEFGGFGGGAGGAGRARGLGAIRGWRNWRFGGERGRDRGRAGQGRDGRRARSRVGIAVRWWWEVRKAGVVPAVQARLCPQGDFLPVRPAARCGSLAVAAGGPAF